LYFFIFIYFFTSYLFLFISFFIILFILFLLFLLFLFILLFFLFYFIKLNTVVASCARALWHARNITVQNDPPLAINSQVQCKWYN